jgi:hypothetical protein
VTQYQSREIARLGNDTTIRRLLSL